MSNEIDLYNSGEIAPYQPNQPLAPSPENWGNTGVDVLTPREIDTYQQQSGPSLFGTPMPENTTPQQVQQVLGEISGVFQSDFSKLGFPQPLIQAALQFFNNNATKAPTPVARYHSFTLPKELTGDYLAESFANQLESMSGSQASKAQFLKATFQWLAKLNQHLSKQVGGRDAPAMEGTPTSKDPLDGLNEQQYAAVIKANDQAQAQTMDYLKDLWGQSFDVNLRMVNNYFAALPVNEQLQLDVFTTGWIKALSTREIILGLYRQACGPLPSGGGVQAEIEECQRIMKVDRKRWNNSEQLQSRYRELLMLRDGR